MKAALTLLVLVIIVMLSACAQQAVFQPTSLPAVEPDMSVGGKATETPSAFLPTAEMPATLSNTPTHAPAGEDPSAAWKQYKNSAFGLSFQYPANWYGPDEYAIEQTLRLAIGSDVVYPYGTDATNQIQTIKNSYYITIQYTKNNQNAYWKDTYQALTTLQDGESFSNARSLIIRVKQISLGRFTGIEYISTLSATAQTEPVYSREVILADDQSNLLTITGMPNNVEIGGAGWREAYQAVDQANQNLFHQIVDSFTVE